MQLINKTKLYDKLTKQEEMIEERCSDLLKEEKKNLRKYIQYRSILSTINSFKYIIDNEPVVEAIPVEQIDHLVEVGITEYNKTKKQLAKKHKWKSDGHGHVICTACGNAEDCKSRFCPVCGAEMVK